MANLKKTMFREYDLRGKVADDELNESTVEIIAKAYGTMLVRRNIDQAALGYDFRECSQRFHDAFIRGLTSTGVNIIDLGMILTPMMYSAQYHYNTRGGAMITASHNPNGWSGFKLALGFSHTLVPEEMKEIYGLTVSEDFVSGHGLVRKEDFLPIYTEDLLKRIKLAKPMKVVVNTGNGTASAFVPGILKKAGCEVVEIYTDLNWDFPRYYPNPSLVEMMEDTGKKVLEAGADIGLAFDGDGDRLGATDEKGTNIFPDQFLILLARQVLSQNPGSKIIFDVKATQALDDDIRAHGGNPIMWITGHSYIKAKLWEEKAPLAGEKSGHIFFGDPVYYGFDDGVFTALRLLDYLSSQNQTFSQIMSTIPQYVTTPTLHVDCADEVKYQVVEKLTQEFKNDGYEVNDINGARVKFPQGWGLVRASSNLPVLVMVFEAKNNEGVDEIKQIFHSKMDKYSEISKEWKSG
ncbi:phosphomannomutase/phosphoglucomutase [Candidatus Microgenomates bacterium]|nr:phosphomannomutase/phosphoglucomutase [Candidatus Microgenomates bacterium]